MDGFDRDIEWIKSALTRVEGLQEGIRKDISDIRELVLRHDEQLHAHSDQQKWIGVVLAATIATVIKGWLHL